jgi:predicted DCC family thiol-disulfide oxidoreductase YuxK
VCWFLARDTAGRVLALPNQTPELKEQFGLTRAEVDRQVWVIDRAGRKWGGAAAVNRALAELGGGWRWLSYAYQLPFLAWIEDRAYFWIAANRRHLARWYGFTQNCPPPNVNCD